MNINLENLLIKMHKVSFQVCEVYRPSVHARPQERIATFGNRTNTVAASNPGSQVDKTSSKSSDNLAKGKNRAKQNNQCSPWFCPLFVE